MYFFLQIDPVTRPTAQEIIQDLQPLFQSYEDKFKLSVRKAAGHKRSFSEEEITSIRKTASPSEKARFHFKSTVLSIGHEMSMRDPHYRYKKHALKKYNQFILNTSCFCTMHDFHNFGLIFVGQCTVCLKV